MSSLPKVCVLDRDGVLNVSSSDPLSPLYYITDPDHLVIKPSVKEALTIIRLHGIPTVLATRQRCLDKGMMSWERVNLIHERLQRMLDHGFNHILIEPKAEDKYDLFKRVWSIYHQVDPKHIHVFDDSEKERAAAGKLNLAVHDGSDLFSAVCRVFSMR